MICTKTAELDNFMKDNLKPARYTHSLGVEKMSARLAAAHGADVEKAAFAGRYHDIAKCFDNETMNRYVRKFGLDDMYIDNNPLAHSKVAAGILHEKFGVNDEEVLDAVRYHTTGRADMTLLEEIVYVADAIEENRNYPGLKELQEQAMTDLDGACLFIMDYMLGRLELKGRILDHDTTAAREFIINRIEHNNNKK